MLPKDTETLATIHKIPWYFQSSPGVSRLPCPKETWRNCSSYKDGETCYNPGPLKLQKARARTWKQRNTGLTYQPVNHLEQALSEELPLSASPTKMNGTSSWSEVSAGGWARTVTYSSWKQLMVPHGRYTSNGSHYGQVCWGQHCHLPGSVPGPHRELHLCHREQWSVWHRVRGDSEDKDEAASHYAQGRAGEGRDEPLPHRQPCKAVALWESRFGLLFVPISIHKSGKVLKQKFPQQEHFKLRQSPPKAITERSC